ncbi:MAG: adenosylcobinamide-GDP ribazoletransferase [Desulfovibrionaceae bacterium]
MSVFDRLHDLLTALGFLSRLGPASLAAPERLGRSLPWFPAVGALLGLIICAPWALGLLQGLPWVQAWISVGLLAWLTRFLHLDGVSDICDAAGSNAQGERFWEIAKDSHAGAFGAAGLALALVGQIILLAPLLDVGAYGAVVHALALGRLAPLGLMALSRVPFRPGLGSMFAEALTVKRLVAAVAVTFLLGLGGMSLTAVALGWAVALAALLLLLRLARRAGGVNGDFLGASIVLGELAGLLGAAAVTG